MIKKTIFFCITFVLSLTISLSVSLAFPSHQVEAVTITGVSVLPNITKAVATYTITCKDTRALDNTLIIITFPRGTSLSKITGKDFKINSVPVNDIQISSNKIYLELHSMFISDPCVFQIDNVVNPLSPGSYTLTLDAGISSTTFNYDIISVTAPVATKAVVSTDENTPVTIELIATDAESDELTYSIVSIPKHGSVGSVTGNLVTYTPDVDYTGTDSFSFKASDATLDSNIATVTINIIPLPTATTTTTSATSSSTEPPFTTTITQPTAIQPTTTYETLTIATATTESTTETSSPTTSTTTSVVSGLFSSCSPSKNETSLSVGDGVLWGSFGTVLLGGYFVAKSRKKK